MAARKLQTEIDRVIKKVAEGVEMFEDTLEKLNEASNPTMKEKYEAELKKEIKKLQRFRDQIKTWISSNEVKDKRVLLENRKLIEQQMERFKAIEKELKTKPFSKEGIQQAARVDPQEREREELNQWLSETMDKLDVQQQKCEAEAEVLQSSMKKSKRPDSSKQERLAQLENHIERHKYHITKLEIVLRLLENGNLSVEQVKAIQDSIDYYVESNQEPEFQEDEDIYEELNLDEAEVFGLVNDEDKESSTDSLDHTPGTPPAKEPVGSPVKPPIKQPGLPAGFQRMDKKEEAKPTPNTTVKTPTTPTKRGPAASSTATPSSSTNAQSSTRTPPATSVSSVAVQEAPPPPPPQQKWATAVAGGPSAAQIVSGEDKKGKGVKQRVTTADAVTNRAPQDSRAESPRMPAQTSAAQIAQQPPPPPTFVQAPQQTQTAQPSTILAPPQQSKQPAQPLTMSPSLPATTQPPESMDNRLPPSLADLVTSFEATKERSLKARDDTAFLKHMLETSFRGVPDVLDTERPKYYHPKSPYPTPSYYPQTPLQVFDNPALFPKFDIDTLFFIFYYQQETYQQYLAAKELKSQSWRFHKKYLTWFQRHEEPKVITDDFEQGTYIYFDYEGAWCQRKKTEFRFDYRFLEDTELL